MMKIVIIGGSLSGHDIAFRLRDKDSACDIAIISEEPYLAYDHLRLADFISGVIPEECLFLSPEDFYKNKNISFIKSKKVSNLNLQKKAVNFKDGGNASFDLLVVACGRGPSIPDIPGAKKPGTFRLYTLDEAKEFLKYYIAEPVCIIGSNNFALKMAEAVAAKFAVEVKLLSSRVFDPGSIPGGVEVINDQVSEIIGEGQVQAVKLASGKAFGACAVLFMDNYKSNIDFLKNSGITVKDDFIVIDGWMRTNIAGIFACGSLVGKESVLTNMMVVDNLIMQMRKETCQTY